mmetsp:Transcript_16531/g.34738  ORF Transcript_16531/g.34738 Transcript_16531/m.34738 type:complete len:82 (+) Transcript_16531:1766-2011(+)
MEVERTVVDVSWDWNGGSCAEAVEASDENDWRMDTPHPRSGMPGEAELPLEISAGMREGPGLTPLDRLECMDDFELFEVVD